eukprot:1970041-Alexandrium_andersonii.AAC.1
MLVPVLAGSPLAAPRPMRTGSESVDGTGVDGSASPSKGSRQQGRGSSAEQAATGSGCLPPTASRGIARRAPP